MEKIIKIIMNRDEVTYEDARIHVECALEMIEDAIADEDAYWQIEEIMLSELGLEMDYFETLMWG